MQDISRDIVSNFIQNFNFSNCAIHVFLPILKKNEPDINPLIKHFFSNHNRLFTSVVSNEKLIHTQIFSDTEYDNDNFGIPVPKKITETSNQLFDVILVPLLYCDLNGNRVGYGKGYYDKFMISQPTSYKIGIGLFTPEFDIEDIESHDVKITQLIGPDFVYNFLQ